LDLKEILDRIDDLEAEIKRLIELPERLAELRGEVKSLRALVINRADSIQSGVDKAANIKTAIQFAAVVLVPILVALIGGYFVLRAGIPSASR
jgi:hypothetical protein